MNRTSTHHLSGDVVLQVANSPGLRHRWIPEGEFRSGLGTVECAVVASVRAQRSGSSYVRL